MTQKENRNPVVGIIAEYNPIHNGHVHHLNKTKEIVKKIHGINPTIVIAMSGDFVQRGEPAIFSKWDRARAALRAGADLVVELPTYYALSSAPDFAWGGLALLSALGVDYLSFSTESGDLAKLYRMLEAEQGEAFSRRLKAALSNGKSYPAAYSEAMALSTSDFPLISGNASRASDDDKKNVSNELIMPNEILALEYLRAIGNSPIEPIVVQRRGAGHNEEIISHESFASGTAIRNFVYENNKLPIDHMPDSAKFMNKKKPLFMKDFDQIALYLIRTINSEKLKKIRGVSEGIENRIIEASKSARNLEELLTFCKTKRITRSRLNRIIFSALLNINENGKVPIRQIFPLAFNQNGRAVLAKLKSCSNTKTCNNPLKTDDPLISYDIAAGILRNSASMKPSQNYHFKPFVDLSYN